MDKTTPLVAKPLKKALRPPRKGPLKKKELKFLQIYLTGDQTIESAMDLAGYAHLCKDTKYRIARKIVQVYEQSEEDKARIMRALGVGEVEVIKRLWKEAQDAPSAVARVAALTTLGKWLGLAKETVEGTQGITVIIKAPDHSGPCLPSGPGPARLPAPASLPEPAEENRHPKPTRPGQPVQIVR